MIINCLKGSTGIGKDGGLPYKLRVMSCYPKYHRVDIQGDCNIIHATSPHSTMNPQVSGVVYSCNNVVYFNML